MEVDLFQEFLSCNMNCSNAGIRHTITEFVRVFYTRLKHVWLDVNASSNSIIKKLQYHDELHQVTV